MQGWSQRIENGIEVVQMFLVRITTLLFLILEIVKFATIILDGHDPDIRMLVAILEIGIWITYFVLAAKFFRKRWNGSGAVILFALMSVVFMILQIVGYALMYSATGLNPADASRSFSDYLYFSAITWTTVGYGELTPVPQARLIAASEAVVGYVFMGFFLGMNIALLLAYFNRNDLPTDGSKIE